MFRVLVVLATILAVSGVALCALTHVLSLVGVVPRFWVRSFAVALLAVFPIGGLAIFLVIRVGRTYGLWGSRLDLFIAGRAPQWLRRVGTGVLLYGMIHFVVFCFVGDPESTSATHISADGLRGRRVVLRDVHPGLHGRAPRSEDHRGGRRVTPAGAVTGAGPARKKRSRGPRARRGSGSPARSCRFG